MYEWEEKVFFLLVHDVIHTYELSMLSIQKRINACGEM